MYQPLWEMVKNNFLHILVLVALRQVKSSGKKGFFKIKKPNFNFEKISLEKNSSTMSALKSRWRENFEELTTNIYFFLSLTKLWNI